MLSNDFNTCAIFAGASTDLEERLPHTACPDDQLQSSKHQAEDQPATSAHDTVRKAPKKALAMGPDRRRAAFYEWSPQTIAGRYGRCGKQALRVEMAGASPSGRLSATLSPVLSPSAGVQDEWAGASVQSRRHNRLQPVHASFPGPGPASARRSLSSSLSNCHVEEIEKDGVFDRNLSEVQGDCNTSENVVNFGDCPEVQGELGQRDSIKT